MAEGGDVWSEVVLKTIREHPWKDDKGFGLWVVQKVKNGKSVGVSVRAGMYKPNRVTGQKELPKDGLEEADFKLLGPIYLAEVLPLLQIPKGTAVDPRAPDAPPEPDIETPPWMK